MKSQSANDNSGFRQAELIELQRQAGSDGAPVVHPLGRRRLRFDEARFMSDLTRCPQRVLAEIVGRQTKQLQDVQQRYGWPCTGPTVDLAALLQTAFDWLAVQGKRLPDGVDLHERRQRPGGN